MKNSTRIYLVIAIIVVGKITYSFLAAPSQKDVMAYVNAIDKEVKNVEEQYNGVSMNLKSPVIKAGDATNYIQQMQGVLNRARRIINATELPANDPVFTNVKETALLQVESKATALKDTWQKIATELYPKRKQVKEDQLMTMYTHTLVFEKCPVNDSIDSLVELRTGYLDEKMQLELEKYHAAKDTLCFRYKIIRLSGF